jgi:hypothetical protein
MNKLRFFIAALLGGVLVFNSCSNDFELTSEWQEIPVVYGILDPTAENQYIRVEKAFLDPENSALQVAKIPDSLYYAEGEISVFIQRKGEPTLYPLTRVDGNSEGIRRDTGIFADSPNWLYKLPTNNLPGGLRDQNTYVLVIKRANGKPDITAETTIPKSFQIQSPNISGTPRVMQFIGNTPTNFRWTHDENAVYFNVTLTIPYLEKDATTGAIIGEPDTIIWRAIDNELASENGGGTTIKFVKGYAFYDMLVREITTPRDGRVRVLGTTVSVKVEGGGREIREFLLTAEANSGITGAELVQTYTNLSEGFGIFSAKNTKIEGDFRFGELTLDSLRSYPDTRLLNFKLQ